MPLFPLSHHRPSFVIGSVGDVPQTTFSTARSRTSRCSPLPSTPLNSRADSSLPYLRTPISPPVADSFTRSSGRWLRWFTLTQFPGVSDTLLHPTLFRRPLFHTIRSWYFALRAQIHPAAVWAYAGHCRRTRTVRILAPTVSYFICSHHPFPLLLVPFLLVRSPWTARQLVPSSSCLTVTCALAV